jgi:hypothetical protein
VCHIAQTTNTTQPPRLLTLVPLTLHADTAYVRKQLLSCIKPESSPCRSRRTLQCPIASPRDAFCATELNGVPMHAPFAPCEHVVVPSRLHADACCTFRLGENRQRLTLSECARDLMTVIDRSVATSCAALRCADT